MLEFAAAFPPEATASIKDDLGPLGPSHFQKKSLEGLVAPSPRQSWGGQWVLQGQGVPSPPCPTQSSGGCHSPATPGPLEASINSSGVCLGFIQPH